MTVRTAAPWMLKVGAVICLGLSLLVLDGRGARIAALVGYVVLLGASHVLTRQTSGKESRGFSLLILAGAAAAALLGLWLGSR
jgi:hypothetical protein